MLYRILIQSQAFLCPMAEFTVSEVIDGDSFKVKNGWKWENTTGEGLPPPSERSQRRLLTGLQAVPMPV